MGMNLGLWTDRLLPHYLSFFIILCFDNSYVLNEEPQILPQNPQVDNENKYNIWITFGTIVGNPFAVNTQGP